MSTKLTLVSVNGRSCFVRLPVDADGKVRANLHNLFGLRRTDCRYQ